MSGQVAAATSASKCRCPEGSSRAVGAIVLAAGASRRLGRPKQRLPYRGRSLLRYAAEQALAAGCRPVVVVLGAHADELAPLLQGLSVILARNQSWEEGLSGSVRLGLEALERSRPPVEAALMLVSDQPLVDASALGRLLAAFQGEATPVVAAAYSGTLGVPAVFHRSLFPELRQLRGDQGAKAVILRHRAEVTAVALPEAALDVDTPADWERLQAQAESSSMDG